MVLLVVAVGKVRDRCPHPRPAGRASESLTGKTPRCVAAAHDNDGRRLSAWATAKPRPHRRRDPAFSYKFFRSGPLASHGQPEASE